MLSQRVCLNAEGLTRFPAHLSYEERHPALCGVNGLERAVPVRGLRRVSRAGAGHRGVSILPFSSQRWPERAWLPLPAVRQSWTGLS